MMKKGIEAYEDLDAKNILSVPKAEQPLLDALKGWSYIMKLFYPKPAEKPKPAEDYVTSWSAWIEGVEWDDFTDWDKLTLQELIADNPNIFKEYYGDKANSFSTIVLRRRLWAEIRRAASRELADEDGDEDEDEDEEEDEDDWDDNDEEEEITVEYLYDELSKFSEREQAEGLHRLKVIQSLMKESERVAYTYARKGSDEEKEDPLELFLEQACVEIERCGGTLPFGVSDWWEERRHRIYFQTEKEAKELQAIVDEGKNAEAQLAKLRERTAPSEIRQVVRRIRIRRK